MAVATMTTVVAMRRRFVAQKMIGTIIVVVLMVIMGMAVRRRDIEVPVQCVPRRPDGLERYEPHQENQKRTTHGAK